MRNPRLETDVGILALAAIVTVGLIVRCLIGW